MDNYHIFKQYQQVCNIFEIRAYSFLRKVGNASTFSDLYVGNIEMCYLFSKLLLPNELCWFDLRFCQEVRLIVTEGLTTTKAQWLVCSVWHFMKDARFCFDTLVVEFGANWRFFDTYTSASVTHQLYISQFCGISKIYKGFNYRGYARPISGRHRCTSERWLPWLDVGPPIISLVKILARDRSFPIHVLDHASGFMKRFLSDRVAQVKQKNFQKCANVINFLVVLVMMT